MAFGNPVTAPNQAFEEFNQGLQPGMQALYAGMRQQNLFAQQTALENQRETARNARADAKDQAGEAKTQANNSAYHTMLQNAYPEGYANITKGMDDATRMKLNPAAMHQTLSTIQGDQKSDKTATGLATYLASRGHGTVDELKAMGPEALHFAISDDQQQTNQMRQDSARSEDHAYYDQLGDFGKITTEARLGGFQRRLGDSDTEQLVGQIKKDPYFSQRPIGEQRQLELAIRGRQSEAEKNFIASHVQDIQENKQAIAEQNAALKRQQETENDQKILANEAAKAKLAQAADEHALTMETGRMKPILEHLNNPAALKRDPAYLKAMKEYNGASEEEQKHLDRPTPPTSADPEKVREMYRKWYPHNPLIGEENGAPGAGAAPVKVSSPEELNALPKGAHYIAPDGSHWIK